ncbi:enoyl-CoA hydratase [Pseudomonas sp. 008]|uniref:enoyl-CoA hydratase n=1 Tax=Pseudomonas sp. 008 TaxID=2803906 RepID=UPI00194E2411|nr:enoyl-CoA hydratase [Pseudomonas sp. 008]GID03285.1 enoyl-CoA hydratase [Pseudomonas sp. 008]
MSNLNDMVLRERRDNVVTLWLNRPTQYNALSEEMLGSLRDELNAISSDSTIRCVVLAAKGTAFCAGHDLREMNDRRGLPFYQELFSLCTEVMTKIQALPVPVIARVQGVATAAGCQLVASCDLSIATYDARFGVSGINLGLFCSTPAVALTRNIALKHAFEMLFTGKFIDANTAVDWGLVNRAVENDGLDSVIEELTSAIASKSPQAVRYGKSMIYRQKAMSIEDAYAYAANVMACNAMESDAIEGIGEFLEKRPK